jgi:hypothetical protein
VSRARSKEGLVLVSARRRRAHLLECEEKRERGKMKGGRGEDRVENLRAVGARRVPRAVQGRFGAPLPTLAPHFECFGNVTGDR